MSDLIFAVMMMVAVAIFAFRLGLHWGRSESRGFRIKVQLLALLLMGVYLAFLWNRPILSRLLPTSSLIIVGNWLPIWGCLFIGLYMSSPGTSLRRRVSLSLLTAVLAGYSTVAPILGKPPSCALVPAAKALQQQTTPYTCSAASAASLLRIHGLDATESELADLCLTRQGTHWMGVYRGLSLKTRNSGWSVTAEPFTRDSLQHRNSGPCVLSFNVNPAGFESSSDHGFVEGAGHSVLFLGSNGSGYVSVFDPAPEYGAEEWDDRMFNCITDGVVLRLVPDDPDSPVALRVQRKLLMARNEVSLVLR
ncbi:MAG: hypothetical protein R3C59_24970 [Planctomycetaceae bacterium]